MKEFGSSEMSRIDGEWSCKLPASAKSQKALPTQNPHPTHEKSAALRVYA